MSSQELKNQAAALEQEFLNQGEALGYSRDELALYTDAFRSDFATVIDNLPRDITLSVNTDPAMRAIEEFVAKAKTALSTVSAVTPPVTYTPPAEEIDKVKIKAAIDKISAIREELSQVRRYGGSTTVLERRYAEAVTEYRNIPGYEKYIYGSATGGLITGPGTGTSDSIPRMLSNGEYVIRASAVSAYGVDFMNALNQQKVGFQPASQSLVSTNSSSSSVVYLSPEDRALLRAAVDRPIALYTENTKIAQSANEGNVLLARRGSN
jgi:hypothetical protein